MKLIPNLRRTAALAMIALAGCETSMSGRPVDSPTFSLGSDPVLPKPAGGIFPTVQVANARGWPAGGKPAAAAGLTVSAFATGLSHPRWLLVLPNGDVLVAETNAPPKAKGGGIKGMIMRHMQAKAGAGVPSPNRIRLLRDSDGDGRAETLHVFATELNSPFGMALVGSTLYVANTDGVVAFPYQDGQTRVSGPPVHVTDLPAGAINHHWTRNILASPDGRYLYATVGSNSNVGENGLDAEAGRAAIWQIDLASDSSRVYATGLRNPNGLAWTPNGALWTVANERDELGNDLVPDYLTSVADGAFYGWPYSYFGQHVDSRVKPQDSAAVARAQRPDFALGAHVGALGLVSAAGTALPAAYRNGMFVGEHGSWNREPAVGYQVVFIPFVDGRPSSQPATVLQGFVSAEGEAWGRPVGVAMARDGALLVADDVGNTVWRVVAAP